MSEIGVIEEVLHLEISALAQTLVVSDLFLDPLPSTASLASAGEVARLLRGVDGPAVLLIAGNLFDLVPYERERDPSERASTCEPASPAPYLSSGPPPSGHDRDDLVRSSDRPCGLDAGGCDLAAAICGALEAHGALREALAGFLGGKDRRAVLLPGTRDRAVVYDDAAGTAARAAGFELALSAELAIATDEGERLILVEPGWRYDERNAFGDVTNPHDTPLGHHVLAELFPAMRASSKSRWLSGIDRLADQASLPRFVASRFTYRKLAHWGWLLLAIPFVTLAADRLPAFWLYGVPRRLHHVAPRLVALDATLAIELVIIAIALWWVNRRLWRAIGRSILGRGGLRANDAARDSARELVEEGLSGLITGHTLQPELVHLAGGFYANTGAFAEVVEERSSPIGLPPVFLSSRQSSYVELRGGKTLCARLYRAQVDQPGATLFEHLAIGGHLRRDTAPPVEVASYPDGGSWPPIPDPARRLRRVRRLAAAGIALAGVLDLISALTPLDLRGKIHPLLHYVPLGLSETAGALVALVGIALLGLARGIRRGQRFAWAIAVVLLGGTVVLHVVKDAAFLASLATLVLLAFLVAFRDCFTSRFDLPSLRTGAVMLVGAIASVTLIGALILIGTLPLDPDGIHLSFSQALGAVATRLAGFDTVIALPRRVELFVDPALLAVGLGIAGAALLLAFRPVVTRRSSTAGSGELARARDIVERRGIGTLDYFALRYDKQFFFDRDGVVAYAIYGGVCLVSPDPIGPIEEWEPLFTAFRRFADEKGWSIAVIGASKAWLSVYRRAGMHDLYYGDEAIVDVRNFSLEGGGKKSLRQAVNRIARYGYTIAFYDPARVDAKLTAALREIMVKRRRGETERGFSMMLGRMFDPDDTGLLLAVASDPSGNPVAFCHYLPAPGIHGYSLDLMRRDDAEHPNGLFDFILVRTIEQLRDDGYQRLGLNFATMRAVLAGEAGDRLPQKMERWLFRRMSDSMQIESLWKFNAKFDPEWFSRYLVWDSAEQSLPAALAIARAESLWELPVIGRFLVPEDSEKSHGPLTGRSGAPASAGSNR